MRKLLKDWIKKMFGSLSNWQKSVVCSILSAPFGLAVFLAAWSTLYLADISPSAEWIVSMLIGAPVIVLGFFLIGGITLGSALGFHYAVKAVVAKEKFALAAFFALPAPLIIFIYAVLAFPSNNFSGSPLANINNERLSFLGWLAALLIAMAAAKIYKRISPPKMSVR
ncbi:hypothetical protein HYU17_00175 [Candidatus Woesearchaeota archaeon]|nr:hypothetical protein [Candidatus Woesearchaeota archaeon]